MSLMGLMHAATRIVSGGIMATNPEWRQPLSKWREYFTDWIETPTPERLLHSNIFFDLDAIWGGKNTSLTN